VPSQQKPRKRKKRAKVGSHPGRQLSMFDLLAQSAE
jgi:hypothetical protein